MSDLPALQTLHNFSMNNEVFRQDILDWCNANLTYYWRPVSTHWLHILIENKQDAMMFKLVWHDDVKRYMEPRP